MPRWFGLFVVLVTAPSLFAADPPVFKAGAATSNITPDLGGLVIGGFAPYPSKHIHDELHARCLVLDDGTTRVAFVICDLLGIHRIVSDEARRLITEATGIPPENVLVAGTHTHSASSALGSDRFRHDQTLDDYQRFVARRIADGVRRAVNTLRPAQIGFGSVEVPEHVFNRRWSMRPGTMPPNPFGTVDQVKMNPPAGSPNLVEPAGPIDPLVTFVSIREPDGKPISLFARYSLHYVGDVGPAHVSADYFGIFCERMKELLAAEHQDPPFVALLANGTSGDINNINFREPRTRKPTYGQMTYVAHDVAAKVHSALTKVEHKPWVKLDARYREPVLKWRRPTPEQLTWAKETLAKPVADPAKTDLSRIYADRTMRMADYPETTPVPIHVFALGDAVLATMPCEIFCEIGLEFRDRSPLQPAAMISLSHGYFGYLPTPRHHDLGGYETWIGTNRLERETSVKLLDELLAMVAEIKSSRGK
jgi:neutral ceramidase